MRAYFYNRRGDLVLGLKKVTDVEIKENRDVDIRIKANDGGMAALTVLRTDYSYIKLGRTK